MSAQGQNSARADRFVRHPRQGAVDAASNGTRRAKAQRRGGGGGGGGHAPGPASTGSGVTPAAAAAVPRAALCSTAAAVTPARQPRGVSTPDEWMCNFCLESGAKRPANVWCATCLKYMCPGCNRQHCIFSRGHFMITLEEFKAWDDGQHVGEPTCPAHGQPLELLCLTCCKCQCVECRSRCDAEKHDVRPIGDPSIDGFVKKLRDDGLSLQQHQHEGGCCLGRFDLHKRQAVRATRDRLLLRIRQHRLAVVNALNLAHAAAEKELSELLGTAVGVKDTSAAAAAAAAASASERSPAAAVADGRSSSAAKCRIVQHSRSGCGRNDKCRGGGNYRTAVAVVDSIVEEQRLLLQHLEFLLTAVDAVHLGH